MCMEWSLINAESEVLSLPVYICDRRKRDSKEENKREIRRESRGRGQQCLQSPIGTSDRY